MRKMNFKDSWLLFEEYMGWKKDKLKKPGEGYPSPGSYYLYSLLSVIHYKLIYSDLIEFLNGF